MDQDEFEIDDDIYWRRIHEVMSDNKELSLCENFKPSDLTQGEVGDCFLLSALSVLCEFPNLIKRLFT